MNKLTDKLLMLALALALPGIGCFSYYTAENADQNAQIPTIAILLAYPVMLISMTTLIAWWFARRGAKWGAWLAGLGLVASAGLLLWSRL